MNKYIHTYIYTYIYIYICICIYVYTYTYTYIQHTNYIINACNKYFVDAQEGGEQRGRVLLELGWRR